MEDLKLFADLRRHWVEVLAGNDQHSIRTQLSRMAWDAAAFESLDRARATLGTDGGGKPLLNGMLHDLIDQGFFATQLLAIRRLVDDDGLYKDRGVWSLVSLIKDMRKNSGLLTRQDVLIACYGQEAVSRLIYS